MVAKKNGMQLQAVVFMWPSDEATGNSYYHLYQSDAQTAKTQRHKDNISGEQLQAANVTPPKPSVAVGSAAAVGHDAACPDVADAPRLTLTLANR